MSDREMPAFHMSGTCQVALGTGVVLGLLARFLDSATFKRCLPSVTVDKSELAFQISVQVPRPQLVAARWRMLSLALAPAGMLTLLAAPRRAPVVFAGAGHVCGAAVIGCEAIEDCPLLWVRHKLDPMAAGVAHGRVHRNGLLQLGAGVGLFRGICKSATARRRAVDEQCP